MELEPPMTLNEKLCVVALVAIFTATLIFIVIKVLS